MKRILIACIGNIFLGDDAFGVEVARVLEGRSLPPEVVACDFGIRGYDLAYALGDGYDAVILVDATPRGEPPGTVYLIEPDMGKLCSGDAPAVDAHNMDPVRVLQAAAKLGSTPQRVYLVGCEPGPLDLSEERMGLSEAVQAAVPQAVALIESLLSNLLKSETEIETGIAPV